MQTGLLGAPRGMSRRPIAAGWPPGYPLGRSVNEAWSPLFSGVGTDMPTDTTSQVVSLPDSGEGQLLILVLGFSNADAAPTTPAGWFALSTSGACFWFWKIADGTEGTSLALTLAVARRGAAYAAVIDKADHETFPYITGATTNVNANVSINGLDQPDWLGRSALDILTGRISSASPPQSSGGMGEYAMASQTCSTATITAWMATKPIEVTDDLAGVGNSQGGSTPSWNARRFLALSYRPNGRIRLGMEGADYL